MRITLTVIVLAALLGVCSTAVAGEAMKMKHDLKAEPVENAKVTKDTTVDVTYTGELPGGEPYHRRNLIKESVSWSEAVTEKSENSTVITRLYHKRQTTFQTNAEKPRIRSGKLEGKTVTITTKADGNVDVQAGDLELTDAGKRLITENTDTTLLLPGKAVAEGDNWSTTDMGLRLFLARAKARFVKEIMASCTLREVQVNEDGKTAIIDVELKALLKVGRENQDFDLKGTCTYDFAKKMIVEVKLAGSYKSMNTVPFKRDKIKLTGDGNYSLHLTISPGKAELKKTGKKE